MWIIVIRIIRGEVWNSFATQREEEHCTIGVARCFGFKFLSVRGQCTSAAEAGESIRFAAGLKTCSTRRETQQCLERYKTLSSDCLNRIHSIRRQFQRAAFNILLHVFRVCCPCKRQHANLSGENKDYLGRRGVLSRGKSGDSRMSNNFHIRGEKRESLIDDVSLTAECADFAVPAKTGITSVLDKSRRLRMGAGHLLELSE